MRNSLTIAFTAFMACALGAATAVAQISQPIIDGTQVPSSTYPNVTPIQDNSGAFCTGTLIAPRFVLTAAHCVTDEGGQSVSDNGITVTFNNVNYQSADIFVHPAYVSRREACVQNEFDAALIQLSNDVAGVTPATLSRSAPANGLNMLLVGYGLIGDGQSGQGNNGPPDGFVHVGNTSIESVDPTYINWSFDPGEANTAGGDSGGPSFGEINSVTTLVGITCGGTGNAEIGTESSNTRVDRIVGWIDAIAGTSAEPTAPSFLGPQQIQGRVGVALSVNLAFSGSAPTSVQAQGLPEGLTLNGTTISGTPAAAGTTTVTITASNELGTNSGSLLIRVTGFSPELSIRKVALEYTGDRRRDFLRVRGNVRTPVGFKPKGKRVTITIGRYTKTCRLDADFGCGRFDYFELVGPSKNDKLRTTRPRFVFQLIRNSLLDELGTLGYVTNPADGQTVVLPVEITINGVRSSTSVATAYNQGEDLWVQQ